MFSLLANTQMKANDNKCHLILSSSEEDAAIQIKESTTKCFEKKKPLGIHIDYKLKFDTDVEIIVKKLTENSMHFQE